MKLTSENVTAVMKDCLFKDDESRDGAILVPGIVRDFGLHPTRLESHREDILSMLQELDPAFYASVGGGWSFLNLPMRKDGSQWGEQANAEELYILAAGLKLAKFCLPREMWSALPGGVPYIMFEVKA